MFSAASSLDKVLLIAEECVDASLFGGPDIDFLGEGRRAKRPADLLPDVEVSSESLSSLLP